jgi:hypothetical protein
MDISRRKRLVDAVKERELGITEQREIFNILVSAGLEYSKNNNGNFFDITAISDEVVERIERFIDFCSDSINILNGLDAPAIEGGRGGQTSRTGVVDAPGREGAPGQAPAPDGPAAAAAPDGMQAVLQENLARARLEAVSSKRKELCRFQQLRKRYSRASSRAQNYPDVLQYDE